MLFALKTLLATLLLIPSVSNASKTTTEFETILEETTVQTGRKITNYKAFEQMHTTSKKATLSDEKLKYLQDKHQAIVSTKDTLEIEH